MHNLSILHHEEIMDFLDDDTDEDNDYDYQDIFPPNRNGIQKRRDIMNILDAN